MLQLNVKRWPSFHCNQKKTHFIKGMYQSTLIKLVMKHVYFAYKAPHILAHLTTLYCTSVGVLAQPLVMYVQGRGCSNFLMLSCSRKCTIFDLYLLKVCLSKMNSFWNSFFFFLCHLADSAVHFQFLNCSNPLIVFTSHSTIILQFISFFLTFFYSLSPKLQFLLKLSI